VASSLLISVNDRDRRNSSDYEDPRLTEARGQVIAWCRADARLGCGELHGRLDAGKSSCEIGAGSVMAAVGGPLLLVGPIKRVRGKYAFNEGLASPRWNGEIPNIEVTNIDALNGVYNIAGSDRLFHVTSMRRASCRVYIWDAYTMPNFRHYLFHLKA